MSLSATRTQTVFFYDRDLDVLRAEAEKLRHSYEVRKPYLLPETGHRMARRLQMLDDAILLLAEPAD